MVVATNNPNIRFMGYVQHMFGGKADIGWAAFIEAITGADTYGLLRAGAIEFIPGYMIVTDYGREKLREVGVS